MSISKNKEIALIVGSAVVSMFALAGTALAADNTAGTMTPGHMNFARPAVVGTVSAINGDILTVASNGWNERRGFASTTPAVQPPTTTPTTYTVDASGATVTKNNAASSVASIVVGDTVMVQGTVSGTNVTATTIRDGVMRGGMKPGTGTGQGKGAPQMPAGITGNGEPVVGGNVTAINGSSLTVTNKSSVTYTVDATNAAIMKGNATSTLSSVAVGDNVVVQGTVNGTAITASTVIDSGAVQTSTAGETPTHKIGGFFGAIGGFFTHLFGFF